MFETKKKKALPAGFDGTPTIPPGHSMSFTKEDYGLIDYKFNEGALIDELRSYINATYDGHYSKNQFQSTEFIIDCGHGMGFALGNVLKYAQRYGKKEGHNRKDLMKILHYALIALNIHDVENK